MASLIFVSLLTWIPLYFETVSIRAKIAVAVVGIIFEEAAWIFAYGPWIKKKLSLEYSTAVDISHEIDPFPAFFIIVLGEYLYSIIVGNPAAIGLNTGLLKAVWTLVIAFSLNWIYSVGDGSMNATHPIRRSAVTAFAPSSQCTSPSQLHCSWADMSVRPVQGRRSLKPGNAGFLVVGSESACSACGFWACCSRARTRHV